jgi:hypothetical protein
MLKPCPLWRKGTLWKVLICGAITLVMPREAYADNRYYEQSVSMLAPPFLMVDQEKRGMMCPRYETRMMLAMREPLSMRASICASLFVVSGTWAGIDYQIWNADWEEQFRDDVLQV